MVSREDVRDVLGGGGLAGGLADLLINGGDVVFALLGFVSESIGVWLALASQLVGLSDRLSWLPSGVAETALVVVSVLFVVVTAGRLLDRARDRLADN